MTAAEDVLARVLARIPASEHVSLVPSAGSFAVPAESVLNPAWLEEQIRLRGQRWNTDDRRVLATLWWYSASVWIPGPTLASLAIAGAPLSPLLGDLSVHWWADSRITGATSAAVLPSADPVAEAAGALRETLGQCIVAVARAGAMRERPLWAIAADSLAGRILWLGRVTGRLDDATALAGALAKSIGPVLPTPRYVDIAAAPEPRTRLVRRGSCCLLYAAPGQSKCADCPKQSPQDRQSRLLREHI